MSYLFDAVMNESYVYGPEVNISDPLDYIKYTNDVVTTYYREEAALYKLETNNICALIEARYNNDNNRIYELQSVMEGFFSNLFKSIVNFVKKIIKTIVNFFKKLFSSSSSSSGGGGGGRIPTREDGKPVVEVPPSDAPNKNITINVTKYPIDTLCKFMDEIAEEAIDNIGKFDNIIRNWYTTRSSSGQIIEDFLRLSPDDWIKKHIKDRYQYLTFKHDNYPMFIYQFMKSDPEYKMVTMNITEYSTDMPISIYENFNKSKLKNIENGITTYESHVRKIYDRLEEIKTNKLNAGMPHTDDNYYDNDDRSSEYDVPNSMPINNDNDTDDEFYENTGKSSKMSYDYMMRLQNQKYRLNHTNTESFFNILNEVETFRPPKHDNSETQIYMSLIGCVKKITIASTVMLQKSAAQLGNIMKKDVEQYSAIYKTKEKYNLV